ncbi:MAG: xanthine dehydrogenase family protein molybdopterin-binding subunit [Vicinamibacterales bacterium]|nr:xanthine dehydrogenase family protein molybdopterin-binding subunit [Vicinamibacterales bacterium]
MNQKNMTRVVGQRFPKIDGIDKVTGVAQFGADVKIPGTLYAKVLRSPLAHAKIKKINTSQAEALPGVKAVITGEDFPFPPSEFGNPPSALENQSREKILARTKVLFQGHPVAAVAATSTMIAEEALKLIDIEYDQLPHVLDTTATMQPGAPLLHQDLRTKDVDRTAEKASNVAEHQEFIRGDADEALKNAHVVVERTFNTGTVHQGYIEPDSEAAWVRQDGSVTVWANTQGTHLQRRELASVLDIPIQTINVIPTEVGGAFGGKESVRVTALCVALSRKVRLPVRLSLGREEILQAGWPSTSIKCSLNVGADQHGNIVVIKAWIAFNSGAFPGAPIQSAVRRVFSHYRVENMRVDAYDVISNRPPNSAYRAPGATPVAFAMESVIDELADSIGMDPLEFRHQNVSRDGDLMPDGNTLPTINLDRVLDEVRQHSCWTTPLEGPNRGRGLALGMWTMPGGTISCHVNVNYDGSLNLVLGIVDLSSTRATLAQIAAEECGLGYEEINVVVGDTDTVAYSDATAGDRVTYVASKAVVAACSDLLINMKQRVAQKYSASVEDVKYALKKFWIDGAPEMSITWDEIALSSVAPHSGEGGGALTGYSSTSEAMHDAAIAPNGSAHVADVEVDPQTGKVQILRYTVFQDVGCAINPSGVEGQMQGGAVQGIGWALSEELQYDDDGRVENASLLDYRLPTILDVPSINTVVLEFPSPDHLYGIRGVGQVPIVPPPATIGNAIFRATGARLDQLPMKPERVRLAIEKSRESH